jgi:ferritin
MAIGKKMEEAINKQINAELFSAYLYQAMSADMAVKNFLGSSQWFKVQAKEETEHAEKFYNFLLDRGGVPKLMAIEAPRASWKSPLEAFEDAYAHELKVTALINGLLETARAEKDYAAESLLKWFIDEQVEEEANATQIVEQFKMVGESKGSTYMIDRKLGKRGKE